MNFLNNPRKAITCYCFINLNLKKILIANHKCGVSYFTHLFTKQYNGESRYIDWKKEFQFGDWHLATEREEIQNFSNQYEESKFKKIMITRCPYDRALSFFSNTFWDSSERTEIIYLEAWKTMMGNRIEELIHLKEQGEFKEGFKMFLDIQWNNPTEGVEHIKSENGGLGDEHLYPQNLAFKDILTNVKFIDVKDCKSASKFLEFEKDICPSARNPSSNSKRVLENDFFDDLDLKAFNKFYRDDFELGYKICKGA